MSSDYSYKICFFCFVYSKILNVKRKKKEEEKNGSNVTEDIVILLIIVNFFIDKFILRE